MMNTILLGFPPNAISADQVARVESIAPDMRVIVTRDKSEIEEVLDDIEIAAGGFPRDLMSRAKNMRWYQQWGAGADWLMKHPEAATCDFVLTNASGVHAIPISEHIISFLLAFARRFPGAIRSQAEGKWNSKLGDSVFELAGQTLLLIGVGAIGARTAQIAEALGMRVIGVRRHPEQSAPGVTAMHGFADLPQLYPEADAVVLTAPLTHETQSMIGEAELRAMKPTACFVNIGRGGTVDEPALIRALREGWIAAAGLDVFADEPLPDDSPLWKMENVVITAHYSGSTPHYTERAFEIFLDNLQRYRAGEPLRNLVDKQLGY